VEFGVAGVTVLSHVIAIVMHKLYASRAGNPRTERRKGLIGESAAAH